MASNVVLSTRDYKVVGTRPIRHDGTDKVTGRAQFGADIQMSGLLHGKILRSPHPHARIRSIDASRALALPAVKAVLTSAELPDPPGTVTDVEEGAYIPVRSLSNNCLAADKVLYVGHALAAVAATTPHVAEQALSLIDVDYEVLPWVTDVLEAMKEAAPVLHETLSAPPDVDSGTSRLLINGSPADRSGNILKMPTISKVVEGSLHVNVHSYHADATFSLTRRWPRLGPRVFQQPASSEGALGKPTNIVGHFVYEVGDLEKGFREADVVVEHEYRTASVHQGYIEPHTATVLWNADGNLTIWCSSQGHFEVQSETAKILGIPVSRVKVVPMEIGGGFGGKTLVYLEPVAALLSRKTGQPVKLTMTRSEVFEGTGPTSGGWLKVKMGAKGAGHITAAEAYLAYEAGAFPGSPVDSAARSIFGVYDIPNARVEGYDVVLNKPKTAAYRAPGAPAAAFAAEAVVDEICERLGMDPLEFRLLNGARQGTRRVTGPRHSHIGCLETLRAAKDHEHYSAPLEGPNKGRGVAAAYWMNGGGPSSATASVNADGTVNLVEGSPDIGGTRVAAAMQLAEVLGIPAEDVRPVVGDTDSVGWTSMTGGSSVAYKTGWACYEAAQDVRRQLMERAARIWDVASDGVEFSASLFSHKSDPDLRLTFKEIAGMLNATGGPIVGRASTDPAGVGQTFAVHIADVEVDPETGKVDILRYTAVQDAGKAIHPSYVEGQMQGGAVQGIGWALNEEYFFNDKGEMDNSSFLDYRMPTSLDLPMIDTVIVEVANPGHPYGARGVGEIPIVPPMAAIANAIYHAVGVRMRVLPMSPGNVLEALWEKQGSR